MKVLILSDIHANYPALEAVLNTEKDYDKLIFLGDVVDYGPHPKECLEFIKNKADYYVIGNHDNALGNNTDCNSMGTFREFSIATREWHKTLLDENDKKFLRSMPVMCKAHFGEKSFFLSHASPLGDISKYLNNDELEKEVKLLSHEFILLGHTHIQYIKFLQDSLVLNPGSVGLSREISKACYAIYENDDFIIKAVDYDVQTTINDLMKSPIPLNCKEGLKKVLLHD